MANIATISIISNDRNTRKCIQQSIIDDTKYMTDNGYEYLNMLQMEARHSFCDDGDITRILEGYKDSEFILISEIEGQNTYIYTNKYLDGIPAEFVYTILYLEEVLDSLDITNPAIIKTLEDVIDGGKPIIMSKHTSADNEKLSTFLTYVNEIPINGWYFMTRSDI